MKSLLFSLLILTIFAGSIVTVFAQQPQLASYRETAQVLVDQKIQNQTTAFVTLTSTSPVEMRVPSDLAEKIRNTANLTSVVITNADNCVLGVKDQACVLVNMVQPSLLESYNITEIQSNARKVGDTLIGDTNKAFTLNAEFNSVYINPKGELNTALGTSGIVSGNRTISVVYTMPKPDSSYLYDGLTSILIPKQLDKSIYFNVGFFPLNSIVEVVVLSKNDITVTDHGGNLAPTTIKNGQVVPADLTKAGWVFDPASGQKISAIYLFGTTTSATSDDLSLTLGSTSPPNPIGGENNKETTPDYSTYTIIGIVAAGGAAVYLFIKRR